MNGFFVNSSSTLPPGGGGESSIGKIWIGGLSSIGRVVLFPSPILLGIPTTVGFKSVGGGFKAELASGNSIAPKLMLTRPASNNIILIFILVLN